MSPTGYPCGLTECIIDGCNHKPHARDLCRLHYKRFMSHGTADTQPLVPVAERLASKLVRIGPVCISSLERWQGRKPHLHVMWDVRYVGFSVLGFCVSVSR